jgi:hypothetical protein
MGKIQASVACKKSQSLTIRLRVTHLSSVGSDIYRIFTIFIKRQCLPEEGQ